MQHWFGKWGENSLWKFLLRDVNKNLKNFYRNKQKLAKKIICLLKIGRYMSEITLASPTWDAPRRRRKFLLFIFIKNGTIFILGLNLYLPFQMTFRHAFLLLARLSQFTAHHCGFNSKFAVWSLRLYILYSQPSPFFTPAFDCKFFTPNFFHFLLRLSAGEILLRWNFTFHPWHDQKWTLDCESEPVPYRMKPRINM